MVYWALDSNRFVIFAHHHATQSGDEPIDVEGYAFFVRSVGNQIVLRDGGGGMAAVRAKAADLAASGIYVQSVDSMETKVVESTVYYRGKAKVQAEAVAEQLGNAKVEELKAKGWLDVIAIMGTD